jgi:hypothetical protein
LLKQKRSDDAGFRLGEFLRNFVQHHRMPVDVQGVTYSVVRWKPPRQSVCTVCPKIRKKELLSDRKASQIDIASLLAEMPEEFDLKPHLRAFMISIADIHLQMRGDTDNFVTTAEEQWRAVIDLSKSQGSSDMIAAIITSRNDPAEILDYIAFLKAPLNYLSELREYNSLPTSFGNEFVTSQDENLILKDPPADWLNTKNTPTGNSPTPQS